MHRYFYTSQGLLLCLFLLLAATSSAQPIPKQLPAVRTTNAPKIDGLLNDAIWKTAQPASNFVEWRPNPGVAENEGNKTVVYLLYDNVAVYVGGYCYERTKDSVSRELIGRDRVGVNDFVGVIFDTYNDKINGFGFYVTPYGEQYDARYSNTNGEDDSWNGVWDSEAKIHDNGWSFEMRIPFSMLRFVSRDNQTWGLNITRRRNKTSQQYMWNPVDPKVNGFLNQEGLWTGIEKINSPIRLSFSPYFSAYVNHYPVKSKLAKDWTSSVNGGMDVKYGISDAFTLDMTLIPDFGQVRSDNKILNLTPFEVRYQENRPFFTEGTELFNKGNLFYSRRIGGTPLRAGSAGRNLGVNETVIQNPLESKLVNASKLSGRTKKGLGIGFFNAVTKPMYAIVEDTLTKGRREVQTGSLTNYNIAVVDQTLKNNSSVSFINTSTIRNGRNRDANVSAALFDFNNKKNTYNWNGKIALSQIFTPDEVTRGYSHSLGFGKTGGRWNFQLSQELADENYDINDMGLLFNSNYLDHYFWTGYRWLKPGRWYNRVQVNFNARHSKLFRNVPGQKIASDFQTFRTNVNTNAQLKNLWWAGLFVGYVAQGNDFYEPRMTGYSFRTPSRLQVNPWFETNSAKKYYVNLSYFYAHRSLFNSPNQEINFSHRYRFSDKFSLSQDLYYNPTTDDAGFYGLYFTKDAAGNYVLDAARNRIFENVLFSRRDLRTIENIVSAKFNFNNKSGITFRARHYWSKVHVKQLYDLQNDGSLLPTKHPNEPMNHQNYNIFNIDAVYTLQFAPGSFINVVWKDESFLFNRDIAPGYFKNFDRTFAEPQNNNLSIKVIYFLDYLSLRKKKAD